MKEDISFVESEKKPAPPVQNADVEAMRKKAIRQIEEKQIAEQEKIRAGIKEPPKEIESVPKEVPYLFFHYGAKALKCEKFQTDDDENRILAKHLSILIGAQNSKVWSLVVILLVILGKLVGCWDAISGFIHRKKKEEMKEKKNVDPAQEKDWL